MLLLPLVMAMVRSCEGSFFDNRRSSYGTVSI